MSKTSQSNATPARRPEDEARAFLEEASLYVPKKINSQGGKFSAPRSLTLSCSNCRLESTTWRYVVDHYCSAIGDGSVQLIPVGVTTMTPMGWPAGEREPRQQQPENVGRFYAYQCADCGQANAYFWLRIVPGKPSDDVVTLTKIGQWPPWSIAPPRAVAKSLNTESLELYKKGRICLSQGYGIAAFTYFRRVVENQTNNFLDMIEEEATAESNADLSRQVADARKDHTAQERLKLAAEMLPVRLRPGGVNPLGRLYGSLSEGLHAQSDEECAGRATQLLAAFDYVIESISTLIEAERKYQATIRGI